MSNPVNIFISYAKEDQQASQELQKSLVLLRRKKVLTFFDQHNSISAGEDRDARISTALANARIVLLILSNDYIASDECYNIQEKALDYFQSKDTTVIPILYNQCNWKELDELARLQALPRNKKFITDWPNEDNVFTEIAAEIAELARKLHGTTTTTTTKDTPSITPTIQKQTPTKKIQFDFQGIRNLVAKSKIENALVNLSQYQGLDKEQRKEITLQQSRWYDLQREIRQGIINNQEANIETNRITLSILDLLDQLEGS